MTSARAAAAFPAEVHEAAAVITFLSPGLRFFHQGQLEGRGKRISPHLVRGPQEAGDPRLAQLLRPVAGGAAPADGAPGTLAAARLHARVGGQLDLGLLPCLRLGRSQ